VVARLFRTPSLEVMTEISSHLWARYAPAELPSEEGRNQPSIAEQDRALTYLERIVDRQLNKVRGVLTFNALILAAFRNSDCPGVFLLVPICACLIVLPILRVNWGSPQRFQLIKSEFDSMMVSVWRRSRLIDLSILLSFVAPFLVAVSLIFPRLVPSVVSRLGSLLSGE